MGFLLVILVIVLYLYIAHYISYFVIKNRILKSKKWDLNICCGKTDGGGVNADIFQHAEIPNYVMLDDIYNLPFKDKQFDSVLCSHTIEHIEDIERFHKELTRVSNHVTYVLPPLYDICAAFDVFEHKWLFLTFRKRHFKLPRYIPLPFSTFVQKRFGQQIKA